MVFLHAAAALFLVPASLVFAHSDRLVHRRASLPQVITKCTKSGVAALTFDDGPWIYENDIIDTLDAAGAKGTFFVNGNNFDCIYNNDPTTVLKKAYKNGHQIGSHTWSHPHLPTLNYSQTTIEFTLNDQALQRILGITPAFLRPPYGEYSDITRQVAVAQNKKLVNWDFDSLDSDGATPTESKQYYDQAIAKHPSSILTLNHEVHEGSAKTVLPYAIQKLKAAGYKLVTVADCLGQAPYTKIASPQSGSFSCNDPPPKDPKPPTAPATHQIHPNGDKTWCVVPKGGVNSKGTPVVLEKCSTLGTKWSLAPGNTAITTNNGAYSLDSGNGATKGTKLKIWSSIPGIAAQSWYLTGDNHIALTGSGLCLDLPSGSKTSGNVLQLWTCDGKNKNQVWTLS